MAKVGRRASKWFVGLSSVLVIAVAGGTVLWLFLPGRAPPPLTELPPPPAATVPSKTELAAIGVFRGMGLSRAGSCTRVLSLDGGGVRGLVPALILAEIERQTGQPIYKQFDLIVGTSTGSIIALGLTRPSNADAQLPLFAAKDLVQFYRDQGGEIFPRSFAVLRDLRRLFRPKFAPEAVEALYEKYFEDVQLHEALTNVAVPAYDIEENRRIWFRSNDAAQGDLLMRELARGATAAPTYFPPRDSRCRRACPAAGMLPLSMARFRKQPGLGRTAHGAEADRQPRPRQELARRVDWHRSIRSQGLIRCCRGWGVFGWMDPLLEIAFSGSAVDEQAERELIWNTYFRLQVALGQPPVGLDDLSPAATRKLQAATEAYMQNEGAKDLSDVVAELSSPRSDQCSKASGSNNEPVIGPRIRHAPVRPQ